MAMTALVDAMKKRAPELHAAHLLEVQQLIEPARARAIREAAGLTQASFAALLHKTPAAVCRWEAGIRRPRREDATAYAALLRTLENLTERSA